MSVKKVAEEVTFHRPSIGPREFKAVERVLKSGWLTVGPEAEKLEDAFLKHTGSASLAVSSNTMGFMLLFKAIGLGPGDEVIFPSWTFTSPALMAYHCGAKVVLVDVDPLTLCMCPEALKQALTPRTKAVVVTDFAGMPADWNGLTLAMTGHRAWLFQDAAHSLGAMYHGGVTGSCDSSDACVFSFYATKGITTGDGGMVSTRNEWLLGRVKLLRQLGMQVQPVLKSKDIKGRFGYEVIDAGFKASLPDINAAVGLVQMKRLKEMQSKRLKIAKQYTLRLRSMDDNGKITRAPMQVDKSSLSSWHLYVIKLSPTGQSNYSVIDRMEKKGVYCSIHFKPLHLHKFWADNARVHSMAISNSCLFRVLSLPIWPDMTLDHVKKVVLVLGESLPSGTSA